MDVSETINVKNLLKYLSDSLEGSIKSFIFDQNDFLYVDILLPITYIKVNVSIVDTADAAYNRAMSILK